MPTAIGRAGVQQLTGQGVQVVEVLPPEEYEWAHLPGAVNLPLKDLGEDTVPLDHGRPVLVYCNDTL